MQKLKARYVGKVIEVFTSGRFSRLTELRVVRWLLNGKDNEEKNRALDELWKRTIEVVKMTFTTYGWNS